MANTWRAKSWKDGAVSADWATLSTSIKQFRKIGYNGANNEVLEIEFTASDASYETIALYWYNNYNAYVSSYDSGRTYRYKVLEAEDSAYTNPSSSTSYDGTIKLAQYQWSGTVVKFTRAKGFKKGKKYYIYVFAQNFESSDNCGGILWGNDSGNKVKTYESLDDFVIMKGGTVPIKVNGTWVDATPQVKVNGVWTDVAPQVKANNVWNG